MAAGAAGQPLPPALAPLAGVCPLPTLQPLPDLKDTSFYRHANVPHGRIEQATYQTESGQTKRLHLYLPPTYDSQPESRYPVLYLNHGGLDDDATWSSIDPFTGGNAGDILDNLIAAGKARPMIIVMPNTRDCAAVDPTPLDKPDGCTTEIINTIVPSVDANYRTRPERESRALAGASKGGFIPLHTGLSHLDTFSELYVYSTGHLSDQAFRQFEEIYGPMLNAADFNDRLRVPLYVAAGEVDIALRNAQRDMAIFDRFGVRNFWVMSTGDHDWTNWRRYLWQSAQLMFPVCAEAKPKVVTEVTAPSAEPVKPKKAKSTAARRRRAR